MKWDRQIKREIMEKIDERYQEQPRSTREEVARYLYDNMPMHLFEWVARVAMFCTLEGLVSEYIRRTRKRMKGDLLNGQETDLLMGSPPSREALEGLILTVPIGGGKFDDIPVLECTQEEVRAARFYYLEQGESMYQRAGFLSAIEESRIWDGLPKHATVRDLYEAA